MSRRLRRTKIVTTLGPATDRDNNLEKIIAAGANVVRMNFSHGTPEDHKLRADKVREIAAKLGRHVAILGDLQGPKIRVLTFKEGKVFLNIGDKFLLDANLGKGEGDKEKVGIDYTTAGTPLAREATLAITLDVPEDTDMYMPMVSRLAQLTVIDVLATGFTLRRGAKFRDNLKRVKEALKESRFDKELLIKSDVSLK